MKMTIFHAFVIFSSCENHTFIIVIAMNNFSQDQGSLEPLSHVQPQDNGKMRTLNEDDDDDDDDK